MDHSDNKRWGRRWYGIGLGGTAVLMALFFITRVPGNPITGRGGGANTISILVEIFEGIFIGIAAGLIVYESRKKQIIKTASPAEHTSKRGRKAAPILAGIVVALVLAGLFVLPM